MVHVMGLDDISSKDVQGRLPTALCHSLKGYDIVFSIPDDGRRKRP